MKYAIILNGTTVRTTHGINDMPDFEAAYPGCAVLYSEVPVKSEDIDGLGRVTPASYVPTDAELWASVRYRRGRLLADTDWTQLPDNELTDERWGAYADYRQALRDLPQTFTDPAAVVWPTLAA